MGDSWALPWDCSGQRGEVVSWQARLRPEHGAMCQECWARWVRSHVSRIPGNQKPCGENARHRGSEAMCQEYKNAQQVRSHVARTLSTVNGSVRSHVARTHHRHSESPAMCQYHGQRSWGKPQERFRSHASRIAGTAGQSHVSGISVIRHSGSDAMWQERPAQQVRSHVPREYKAQWIRSHVSRMPGTEAMWQEHQAQWVRSHASRLPGAAVQKPCVKNARHGGSEAMRQEHQAQWVSSHVSRIW